MIEKRTLGRTGIEITPIGLGTWQFAQGSDFTHFIYEGLEQDLVNDVVRTVLEGGINWFDTAEAYGWGRSERSLAEALSAAGATDDEVVVATKWFPSFRTAESISRTIVKRRRCLKPFGIGLTPDPPAYCLRLGRKADGGHVRTGGPGPDRLRRGEQFQ